MKCKCGCGLKPNTGRSFISGHNLRKIKRTAIHRQRIAEAQKRAWQTKRQRRPIGSKNNDAHGYVRVKVVEGAGRWEKEHILVMQHKAGRRLARGEMVHHINGKRNDNDLSNLFLCKDHAEHMRIHASAMSVIYELLRDGLVVFNRKLRRYERVL